MYLEFLDWHIIIDHFTDVCSLTWPLNGSETGGDLVLIQTSPLFLCKSSCSYANEVLYTAKKLQNGLLSYLDLLI